MDELEEKARKVKEVRASLVWDDWAIHWLINSLDDLNYHDDSR